MSQKQGLTFVPESAPFSNAPIAAVEDMHRVIQNFSCQVFCGETLPDPVTAYLHSFNDWLQKALENRKPTRKNPLNHKEILCQAIDRLFDIFVAEGRVICTENVEKKRNLHLALLQCDARTALCHMVCELFPNNQHYAHQLALLQKEKHRLSLQTLSTEESVSPSKESVSPSEESVSPSEEYSFTLPIASAA